MASIVTSSNDAIIGETLDGVVTSWNPAAEAMYGYSAEEMIAHSLTMAIPPDRLDEFKVLTQSVGRGEQVRHFETLRKRKNGQIFHVALSISPIKDQNGKIEGISTVVRDITEHKLAEERTERLNRALRALSECTQRLMRANDEPTVLQQVCDVMVQIAGYRMAWVGYAEHDENKSVRPMAAAGFEEGYLRTADITWADVERGNGPTGTSIRTGTVVVCDDVISDPQLAPWREYALRQGFRSSIAVPLKIGTEVMGTLTIYAIEPRRFQLEEKQLLEQLASNMTYAIVTLRARAERNRAEEELRQTSRYARSLIEASLDPLVTISKDGKIMDVNRATEEATGVARQELVGSDFSTYFTEPEKAQQGYQQVYDQGFVQDYPLAIRHTSGRVIDVLYNATVFKNEAGEIQGVFAAARDITRRQQAEQKTKCAS
jgi:PAS domain S-box-containing protein